MNTMFPLGNVAVTPGALELLEKVGISPLLPRATGHRTATQVGHHVKTIESLELTIKASPKLIQKFKTFNNKRNKSSYDVAGVVSDQELDAMLKLATELKHITVTCCTYRMRDY
jgi:hypothetical protein